MENDAVNLPRGRRGGCLKWTCGCLAVALVAALGLLFLLWHSLTRWDSRPGPWENLPPTVAWAVEVRDFQTLAGEAMRDPGFAAFLDALLDALNRRVSDENEWRGDVGDLFAAYRSFSWLHRAVLPNAFLVGGDRRDADGGVFFIVQPPAWLRFALSTGGWGKAAALLDDDEIDAYLAYVDDWMIIGSREDVVQAVVDGWDAAAAPLGPRPDNRGGAYLAFAVSPETPKPAVEARPEPDHFAFADPFAAAGAAAPAAEPSFPAARFLMTPGKDAWRIWGESFRDGAWPGGQAFGELAHTLAEPAALRTAEYDLAVSARLGTDAAAALRSRLETALRTGPGGEAARDAVRAWLRDGWLACAGDAATLLAASPSVRDDAYPGMPVTALAWPLRDGIPVETAASRFASLFEDFSRSLREGRDAGVVRYLLDDLAVHVESGGMEGRIDLPPVMVNGARPGWRFEGEPGGAGWVATDVDALSRLPAPGDLPLADLERPETMAAEAAGAWVLSRAFVEGAGEWLRDRFEMTSWHAELDENERTDLLLAGELVSRLLGFYPRGAFRMRYDDGLGRGAVTVRVPYGGKVSQNVE